MYVLQQDVGFCPDQGQAGTRERGRLGTRVLGYWVTQGYVGFAHMLRDDQREAKGLDLVFAPNPGTSRAETSRKSVQTIGMS